MPSTEKPLTYEEERQRIIEENKRRMKELGLLETIELFQKAAAKKGVEKAAAKKGMKRAPNNLDFATKTRRSSRAASRPKVDYKEGSTDVGLLCRTRGIGRPLKRPRYVSSAAKNEAAVRAGDIKTSHPSFVKAMLKSHTSGGFWLGLPSDFCYNNFIKDDVVILEDEDGLEWECVYLHHKHGLSGGWRGFSIDHDLDEGDAVVFELVTPTRYKVYITRAAAASEGPATKKTTAVVKKKSYQYVVTGSKNVHVHSALHKSLKIEKGDEFDAIVRRRSKSAKPVKRNVKSRYDWSSDESQESDDAVDEASEDESEASDSAEDSDEEDAAQSSEEDAAQSSEEDAAQSSEEEAEQSSEEDAEESSEDEAEQSFEDEVQPARKLKEKISLPAKRSIKSNQQSPVTRLEDPDEDESDDDIQRTKTLKEKISKVTKRTVKSKKQSKSKTEPKSRLIPSRKESSRASVKVAKKDAFVRRADRRTDIQEVRKEIAARQIELKCNLPPGARLKPIGVCSIARGSGKRKLPAIFPARKYSFFNGPKSVKVH
ncbi:unnamed protein product [Calypogeia fissa]